MSNGVKPQFTETQQKIVNLLSDGNAHQRKKLHALLPDPQSKLSSINIHISRIREKIEPQGYTIVCELVNRQICYRHVRLLHPDSPVPGYNHHNTLKRQQRAADWDER
jgi:hypothetical protein